jgi:hypothetical protein
VSLKKLKGITDPYKPKRKNSREEWPGTKARVMDEIRGLLDEGWSTAEIIDELGCYRSTVDEVKSGIKR